MEICFACDVRCAECNTRLDGDYKTGDIIIIPCEVCMDRAKDNGLDEGYEKGKRDYETK